jgi:hypothetical protein
MKKIVSVLGIGIMCFAATAFAVEDWTMLGSIKANAFVDRQVTLPAGQLTLEVIPSKDTNKITCQFMHNSAVVIEQKDTNHCKIDPLLLDMTSINIKIINLDNKDTDYKIWIHGGK